MDHYQKNGKTQSARGLGRKARGDRKGESIDSPEIPDEAGSHWHPQPPFEGPWKEQTDLFTWHSGSWWSMHHHTKSGDKRSSEQNPDTRTNMPTAHQKVKYFQYRPPTPDFITGGKTHKKLVDTARTSTRYGQTNACRQHYDHNRCWADMWCEGCAGQLMQEGPSVPVSKIL